MILGVEEVRLGVEEGSRMGWGLRVYVSVSDDLTIA